MTATKSRRSRKTTVTVHNLISRELVAALLDETCAFTAPRIDAARERLATWMDVGRSVTTQVRLDVAVLLAAGK